jgi:hypothetical protein
MRRLVSILALGATLALSSLPALAQGTSNPTAGTGGAKEQMLPSTVGVDSRPDRGSMRARRPMFRAIEARPGWRAYYGRHARWHRHHHRHWR